MLNECTGHPWISLAGVRGDFTSAVSLSLPDRGQAWVARKFDPFTSHKTRVCRVCFGEFWKILAVRFTVIDWISNTNDLIGIIIYLKCLFFDKISIFHLKCLNTIARCFSTFLEILHLSDVVIVYVSDRILVQGDIGVINNVKMNFNFLNSSLFSLFLWNWILNTNDRFDIIIQSI